MQCASVAAILLSSGVIADKSSIRPPGPAGIKFNEIYFAKIYPRPLQQGVSLNRPGALQSEYEPRHRWARPGQHARSCGHIIRIKNGGYRCAASALQRGAFYCLSFFRPMNDHAASAITVTATMIHISRKISPSEVMRVMPMPAMTNIAAIIKNARINSTYQFSLSI